MYDNILYKIKKYKTKFEKESDQETKLIYARKYIQYINYVNKNINSLQQVGGATPEQINVLIVQCNDLLEKINDYITILKPTYDLIKNMDDQIKTLNPGYQGYNNSVDLIEYYDQAASQCDEIV